MTMNDRERATSSLRTAIQIAAREAFGAGMVERPIPGFSTRHRDVEPIAGVRAAVLAREVATGCVRDYAQPARADGHSWDDIAEALGLEQVDGPMRRGERAYLHLTEDRQLYTEDPDHSWRSAPAAHWRCATCDQYVTDHGPVRGRTSQRRGRARPGVRPAHQQDRRVRSGMG